MTQAARGARSFERIPGPTSDVVAGLRWDGTHCAVGGQRVNLVCHSIIHTPDNIYIQLPDHDTLNEDIPGSPTKRPMTEHRREIFVSVKVYVFVAMPHAYVSVKVHLATTEVALTRIRTHRPDGPVHRAVFCGGQCG